MPDLRPGNRGIGVSVAVGTHWPYGDNLARTVIRKLVAHDESARVDVVIQPGVLIDTCRIHRNAQPGSEDDVYIMEFESNGRRLRCALVQFQARTQTAVPAGVDERPPASSPAAA